MRAGLDEEAVRDIADAILKGEKIERVVAFGDGDTNWLADGRHRYCAHEVSGQKTILVELRPGGKSEALEYAIRFNTAQRRVRTTAADQKIAIDNALRDGRLGSWTDNALSALLGCDNETITRRRAKLAGEEVPSRAQEKYRRAKHPFLRPSRSARVEDEPGYDEWFTSAEVVEAVRTLFGGAIDLDPASCAEANQIVRARTFYDKASDGLTRAWGSPESRTTVFLNSPYSLPVLRQFIDKALAEYEAGHCSEMVILNNARSEMPWFQKLAERHAVVFTYERLKFGRPADSGRATSNQYGQAIFYLGPNVRGFYAAFSRLAYAPNLKALMTAAAAEIAPSDSTVPDGQQPEQSTLARQQRRQQQPARANKEEPITASDETRGRSIRACPTIRVIRNRHFDLRSPAADRKRVARNIRCGACAGATHSSSPLRYPGAKTRARDQIIDLIPEGVGTLLSPFFGGGSVELAAASRRGMIVHGYDLHLPLVLCWQCMIEDASRLADEVDNFYPLSREQFRSLQRTIYDYADRPVECAARYFALNRAAFSGCSLSAGMSSPTHTRFKPSAIEKLRTFRTETVSVNRSCFTESIPRHPDAFIYADPPYPVASELYGDRGSLHRDFDHEALRELLAARHGWILSYNDCAYVRRLYDRFHFVTPRWKYGMPGNKESRELLILSPDL